MLFQRISAILQMSAFSLCFRASFSVRMDEPFPAFMKRKLLRLYLLHLLLLLFLMLPSILRFKLIRTYGIALPCDTVCCRTCSFFAKHFRADKSLSHIGGSIDRCSTAFRALSCWVQRAVPKGAGPVCKETINHVRFSWRK